MKTLLVTLVMVVCFASMSHGRFLQGDPWFLSDFDEDFDDEEACTDLSGGGCAELTKAQDCQGSSLKSCCQKCKKLKAKQQQKPKDKAEEECKNTVGGCDELNKYDQCVAWKYTVKCCAWCNTLKEKEEKAKQQQKPKDKVPKEVYRMGCYKDDAAKPAMTLVEGKDDTLKDDYKTRVDAINKCYQAVKKMGGQYVFGIQDGGKCFAGDNWKGFRQYGKSEACKYGKGGPLANEVYSLH